MARYGAVVLNAQYQGAAVRIGEGSDPASNLIAHLAAIAQPLAFLESQSDLRTQLAIAVKRVFGETAALQLTEA